MRKQIISTAVLLALSGCGGSSSEAPKDTTTDNTTQVITGDTTASADALGSATGSLTAPSGTNFVAKAAEETGLGSFTIYQDGTWSFDASASNPTVLALAEGETATEEITVTTATGEAKTITVTVTGVNDAPIIGTGNGVDSTTITTDSSETVSGTLTINDPDAGQSSFVAQTDTQGDFGAFSITEAGEWAYALADLSGDAKSNTLKATTKAIITDPTDSFIVVTADGTEHNVVIQLQGDIEDGTDSGETDSGGTDSGETDSGETDSGETDSGETDSGETDSGGTGSGGTGSGGTGSGGTGSGGTDTPATPAVIEGTKSANIYHTGTSVTGTFTIIDDNDEAAFNTTASGAVYGSLTITSAGVWTYVLNTAHTDVDTLVLGQSLTDTITVTSIDGTEAKVNITIVHSDSASLIVPSLPSEILSVPPISCDQVFTDPEDLEDALFEDMVAGTTLCMADGTYTEDFKIEFGGAGTKEAPIKVAAENPGKVIFSGGEVKIKMGGSYTQLQGFIFENNISGSNFIETRFGTADLCHNCRITENTIINAKAKSSGLVLAHIYGKNVWVDHNIFSGKTAEDPMISINRWVDDDWTEEQILAELADGIVVYGNYIANRPPPNGKMYANSGDNNYEAVRTGLSDTHHYPSNSIVAGNLFENIQGEAEVISNKGSNNVISGNTVRNSYGSITNRHGNTNVISNNFMFGDGFPYAGGLRIVDDGHTITNNYIEGARYQKTSHHGGIVIIGSDGDGDGDNGYQQVENVHIAHNTVVNSVNSVNIDGGGKKTQPKQVYFANNIVDRAIGDVFVDTARGVSSDSAYAGNIVFGDSDLAETNDVDANVLGATFISPMLEKADDGLYRPSDNSPSLTAVSYDKGDFADVTQDMDGTARGDATEAGADDINTDSIISTPLSYDSVGPQSYRYAKPAAIMVESDLSNADFEAGLTGWTGGTLINVSEGAFAGNSLLFSGSSTADQTGIALTPDANYAISAFVNGTYSLVVNDHVFEGNIDSSSYTYVYHEFKTGPSETSGTITLKVADEVATNAGIQDGNMDDFRSNDGKLGVWKSYENGLVDIRDASESAFSSGSARISFPDDEIHDFTFTPGLTQSLTGVPTGVDLTYSLYYCDTKAEDEEVSITTLHYGVKDAEGNVIAEARANESELDDAPRGRSEVCFKQVALEIPNNSETELEVFAFIEVDNTMTHEEIEAHEQFTKYDLRVYIDEFSLTYQVPAAPDAETKIDEVRLVERTIDELSD